MIHILLIDSNILDPNVFIDSCNDNTIPFLYSQNTTREELSQFLEQNIQNFQIQRLAFVFEKKSNYIFLNNEPLFIFDNISANTQFLINIIQQYNVVNVDFLACETLLDYNWNNFYDLLMENTNVIIGASNNKTGNLLYGGDWIMESTNEDIEVLYFNKSIEYYKYLLGVDGYHTAIILNGVLYACGSNVVGQLGNNTNTDSTIFVQMINNTGKTPQNVSTGSYHTMVKMTDGTLWGCGNNNAGQLGNNTNTDSTILVQMINNTGKTPDTVSCGADHTIVMMTDGSLYSCGNNNVGQLGDDTNIKRNTMVPMINNSGQTPASVSCGASQTMVLMTNNTVWGCGGNFWAQLGDGTTTSRKILTQMINDTGKTPITVSGGGAHTVIKMSDNTLWGCGYNVRGQIGSTLGTSSSLVNIINNTGKTPGIISCGSFYTVVKMTDNTIWGCGSNNDGQLGNDTNTLNNNALVQMINDTGKTPETVICGNNFSLIKMTDNTFWATGNNDVGQLGDTTNTSKKKIVQMIFNTTPTISDFTIPAKTFGDTSFSITDPTSNSSGSFSYTSSNTSVATISGNTLTIVGSGNSTITATQEATSNYSSGTITTSFQVNSATPTINNFTIPTKTFGDISFSIINPTSNSSGSFSYTSSNTSVATISGNTITIIGSGNSTITATQEATSNYSSGTITTSFQVNSATPTISDFTIPAKTFGDTSFTITVPTSNSTGSFSYTSSNTSVATISGNTITIIGSGTSTIISTQEETTNYTLGTITTSFQVNSATPTISDFTIPTKTFGDTSFTITDPTSNSTGLFSYTSSNTSVATIYGNIITIIGSGTSTITSTQEETLNYTLGTITTSFQVNSATPTINNFTIPTKTFGNTSFTIADPTSNSSGSFSYTSSNTSVATISGNTITIIGSGISTITATQEATSNYTLGTITTTFQVNSATPTITNFTIPTKTFGENIFTLNDPTSNSSGLFSYASSDTSVATISGNIITIIGSGTSTITATQEATSNYTLGTITTIFPVNINQQSNPAYIYNTDDLYYLTRTTAKYGYIVNSIDTTIISSSTTQVLFTNNFITITNTNN